MLGLLAIEFFIDAGHLLQQIPILLLSQLMHLGVHLAVNRTQPVLEHLDVLFVLARLLDHLDFQLSVLFAHLCANSFVVFEFIPRCILAGWFVR